MFVRMFFWVMFTISVTLIIVVKLTPFKDLPQPSWFNYGNGALEIIYDIILSSRLSHRPLDITKEYKILYMKTVA